MKKGLLAATLVCSSAAMAQLSFTANSSLNIPSGSHYVRAAVDMNGDYLDDIVATNSNNITILYQQANGSFTTLSMNTSNVVNSPDWSLAIGDIDKNGFNDIVYGGGGGVTFMKANNTGTAFTEITFPQYVFSQRSNFVDINNDGHLDAFVCHDVNPNVYYLNDGSGNLVFNQGGIGDHMEGGNYGSIWVDYDNDGDQDCFIAKCRGGGSTASYDELHKNNGDGTFTEVAFAAGIMNGFHQAWSAAWNDYDNDGDMDAMVGESGWGGSNDGHKLMSNDGDGTFTDVTAGSGWDTYADISIEHVSFDFDNDGFADVLSGGSLIRYNNGDMTFTESNPGIYGGSVADLNDDGFLDLLGSGTVYFNNGNSNNWIKIQLKGIASNYNGIGARVELYGAWGKQIRDVRSGDGFANMNTLNVHFGIGTATEIDSVRVIWPSGQVDVVEDPTINSNVTMIEGVDPLSLVEVEGKKISLFPNPTTDYLAIENIDLLDVAEAAVYNMKGEKVLTRTSDYAKVDVSALAEGAYIIVIQTKAGERYSEAFVKKNN
ncbi:MAG TPA: FG-GAP-like repeat-containing protein [Fluviicola sp.]|nr:FG-GAP-like repeat-containing protein [Fluviicola sp.]